MHVGVRPHYILLTPLQLSIQNVQMCCTLFGVMMLSGERSCAAPASASVHIISLPTTLFVPPKDSNDRALSVLRGALYVIVILCPCKAELAASKIKVPSE